MLNRICPHCNISFTAANERKVYCSRRCKQKASRKRQYHHDVDTSRAKNRSKWKRYYQAHKEQINITYRHDVKINVLTHYGNAKLACVQCGEARLPCLTIDHVDNNGNLDRKGRNLYGSNFYKMLRRQNYPSGFQTLCMNCQFIKMHDVRRVTRDAQRS